MNHYLAFSAQRLLVAGDLLTVALALKAQDTQAPLALVFAADSGRQIDIDVRGSEAALKQRYGREPATAAPAKAGRGRPKLGVVGREVTLLPRHWTGWKGSGAARLRRCGVSSTRRVRRTGIRTRCARRRIAPTVSCLQSRAICPV